MSEKPQKKVKSGRKVTKKRAQEENAKEWEAGQQVGTARQKSECEIQALRKSLGDPPPGVNEGGWGKRERLEMPR